MARCAYCNTLVLFGGKTYANRRYCSVKCQQQGVVADVAESLPQDQVAQYAGEVYRGACPACQGPGPNDVHTSYRVWSAVYLTSWSSRPAICCRRCGTKRKLLDTLFSGALGWWGLPWGLLMTPIQIGKNLFGLARQTELTQPSPALEKMVRHHLAAHVMQQQAKDAAR